MKPIIAAHRLPTSPLGKLPRSLAPLRIRSRNHVAGRRPTVWGGHSCPPPLTSKRRTDHPRAWPIRTPTQNRMPHPWQFHGWAAANFPARYPSQLNRSRLCDIISIGVAHPYSEGCPVQAPLGRGFPRPEPTPQGAGPSVPQHKTGCPTRGGFTGGPLQTFPHVIRPS
jgi:hypothetical protein